MVLRANGGWFARLHLTLHFDHLYGDDVPERHVDNVEPEGRPSNDARTTAVAASLPPSKPAAINAVFPQEADGDESLTTSSSAVTSTLIRQHVGRGFPAHTPRHARGSVGDEVASLSANLVVF